MLVASSPVVAFGRVYSRSSPHHTARGCLTSRLPTSRSGGPPLSGWSFFFPFVSSLTSVEQSGPLRFEPVEVDENDSGSEESVVWVNSRDEQLVLTDLLEKELKEKTGLSLSLSTAQ